MENTKNKTNFIIKIFFIISSILLIIPSVMYLIKEKTIFGFNTYYNFSLNPILSNFDNILLLNIEHSFITNIYINKFISTTLYLSIFIFVVVLYLIMIKRKNIFKNIKQQLVFTGIISAIFIAMLPWTSSDIFYYMGVGELNSVYNQNPYYITIKDYYEENEENIQDEILYQGYTNVWADTTVVYGPIAQLIFSSLTKISFKNIDFCIFLFKLLNVIIHLLNCYLIYKITKKLKFSLIYGLNPFIFIEFIGNVHNDIIIVFFVLLSLYYLIKKKKLLPSIIFLAIATGIKYFTILLLPIYILYHYRKEEKISVRFLQCIKYGIIFALIIAAEYLVYFRDLSILTAMMVQTERYCKSIYSAMFSIEFLVDIVGKIRNFVLIIFVILYIKFCIDLLTTKDIKFYKIIRKYNYLLILFLLCLSNFQQWYLIWLIPTIMWQKPNMIRNIIGVMFASEIANSIYMYKSEYYIYDIYFVEIIVGICIFWQIFNNKDCKALIKNHIKKKRRR